VTTGLIIDALIILFYFVLILSIGLYMGRRENSLHDFALGGRNVPWWAVMASIIATETSAATFLGAPGEGYKAQSIAYAQLVVGLILGRMMVGFVFLKPYYLYKVYTVYDYLGVRFGTKSKNFVSGLFLVMRTLASGTRLFVPSLVMVLAYKIWASKGGSITFSTETAKELMPYFIAIVGLTLLTCLYTALGGIKAVIWTDVVQATLMFGSAIVSIFTILYFIGGKSWNFMDGLRALGDAVPQMKTHEGYFWLGWEESRVQAYAVAQEKVGRVIDTSNLSAWEWVRLILGSEFTLFSATIGAIMGNMAAFGTDQDMVQRLLTAETYKKSRRSLITAAVMDLPIAAFFSFIGVCLVAYFQQYPQCKPPDNADVFGSFILNVMPPGIRGLILAGVFATAMGSLSAALNALATSATNDWYIPFFARRKSEAHHVSAARAFTIVFALLMIAVAVGTAYVKVRDPEFRIIPFVIGIAGLFLGPMLGVFLIGMFTKRRGSDVGNVIAIAIGLIGMFFITGQHIQVMNMWDPPAAGQPNKHLPPHWLPAISWTWYAIVGAFIVFVVGVLFRTPDHVLAAAERKLHEASQQGEGEKPLSMRGH